MATSSLSTINGGLAAATPVSARSDGRSCRVSVSLSQSFRTLDLGVLSFTVSRRGPHRSISPGLVRPRAVVSAEAVEELDGLSAFNGEAAITEEPKLYVGNLPWSCTSEELAECFQKVGSVELSEVFYDRDSGRSRGFGFVTMSSMEDANLAIQKLDGADYAGRALRVNFSNRNRGDPPPPRPLRMDNNNVNKLFVGNLAWGVDSAMLEQLFSEHGTVVDARIVNDRDTGRSRGFGFVTMGSEAEVNEALNKMDGAFVEGRNLRVNVAGDRPASRTDFF